MVTSMVQGGGGGGTICSNMDGPAEPIIDKPGPFLFYL